MAEWRSVECKSKKQSFQSARENEKMQDAMLDVRIAGVQSPTASTLHLHNTKLISDKENTKVSLSIVARGSFLKKYLINLIFNTYF